MEINRELVEGVGVITPPRRYRDNRTRTRARGYAPTSEGIALAQRGVASVKVTRADGSVETRSVHSFRKGRAATPRTAATPTYRREPEVLRLAHIVGTHNLTGE